MAVVSPAPGMGSVGFGDGLQSALFQEALLTEFKNNFAQSLTTFTGCSHGVITKERGSSLVFAGISSKSVSSQSCWASPKSMPCFSRFG